MSKSSTTTNTDWLELVHPGEILREDFLIGGDVPVEQVVAASGIDGQKLLDLLAGKTAVDADSDLRLGRYFGMSEGFFLRLQNSFDLEEVRRAKGAEIEKINRRAA